MKYIMRYKRGLLLLFTFLIYSLTIVFMKEGSSYDFLSGSFLFFYALSVCVLAVYASCWQFVLKRVPLNIAFTCKSSTIIIVACLAYFIYGEQFSLGNMFGIFLIMIGLLILPLKEK